MSAEKDIIFVSKLENAWRKRKIKDCYELLSSIPDGVVFRAGNLLFELTPSMKEEKKIMQRSVKVKKELSLIKTAEGEAVIEGSGGGIDLDDIAGALYRTVRLEKPAIFSHTHWDIKKHPLPGFTDIGFGDIPLFNMFIGQYPLLECRAVFNDGNTVRSIIYKGQVK